MLKALLKLFSSSQRPKSTFHLNDEEGVAQESFDLTPSEVKAKIDQSDSMILLDVRTPQEVEMASIDGTLNIPMQDVHQRYSEISDDPTVEIICICHYGIHSTAVMHQLWGLGFQNAKNMSGGIDAWSMEVDPKVPRY